MKKKITEMKMKKKTQIVENKIYLCYALVHFFICSLFIRFLMRVFFFFGGCRHLVGFLVFAAMTVLGGCLSNMFREPAMELLTMGKEINGSRPAITGFLVCLFFRFYLFIYLLFSDSEN